MFTNNNDVKKRKKKKRFGFQPGKVEIHSQHPERSFPGNLGDFFLHERPSSPSIAPIVIVTKSNFSQHATHAFNPLLLLCDFIAEPESNGQNDFFQGDKIEIRRVLLAFCGVPPSRPSKPTFSQGASSPGASSAHRACRGRPLSKAPRNLNGKMWDSHDHRCPFRANR